MKTRTAVSWGIRTIALMVAVVVPLGSHGEPEKPLPQKYLKDMEALYGSLAITDAYVKDPQQTTETFRPRFKITNLTNRTLEVPLMPGLPPDKACVLGKATCTIRLIGDAHPKGAKPIFSEGSGATSIRS
jgi:hypothetical protein